VVDTDETASKVLDIMLKEKRGRVTFMPLNRLKPKNPVPPNAQDAIPLIDKLRYDPVHQKAFQQVFGKTCVCRDLTIAAAYVKSHGINTITLDGDKVDRKGALTGGYHDVRRSRIEAIKSVQHWRSKFEADEKRSKEVKAAILQIEQEITKLAGKIAVAQSQQKQTRDSRERLLSEGVALSKEKERLSERTLKLEADEDDLETEWTGLGTNLETLVAELAAPMAAGLTREEESMIEALGKQIEQRRKDMMELSAVRNKVGFYLWRSGGNLTRASAGESEKLS
jgi:structural maintenance of chromosome 3 (chondroitin sulfate proteoglycan 6)